MIGNPDSDINAILNYLDPGLNSVGVKANIAVAGQPWHGGIKAYKNNVASEDAYVIGRLRKAGYPISAIVNMEEGALGAQTNNPWFGKTHNPLKFGYTPGGSSGGSAAAVAAGLVDIALGTDTMGSVRIPSAYCGLWGFKPSHCKKMLEGVMPLSQTLDTVGIHAKSLDDCVRAMEIIHPEFSKDFGYRGKIHVLDWADYVECEPDVQRVFDEFVSNLGILRKTNLEPYKFAISRRAGLIISETEGYSFHKPMLDIKPDAFSPFFKGMLEYGASRSQEKIEDAYDHIAELRQAHFPDFVLMPTAPQTAFKFGDRIPVNQADFTAFANLSDRPTICFPIGVGNNGLPVSAQLVGPRNQENDLVATVRNLQINP